MLQLGSRVNTVSHGRGGALRRGDDKAEEDDAEQHDAARHQLLDRRGGRHIPVADLRVGTTSL